MKANRARSVAFLQTFGDRMRAARLAAGMSQDELAHTIGLSRATVAQVELGKQDLRVSHLAKYAEALGVKLATLLAIAPATRGPKLDAWRTRAIKAESTLRSVRAALGKKEARS